MIKAGRFTAAFLLILVGVGVVLDQSMDLNVISSMLDWWPLILIFLGMEYMLTSFWNRHSERRVKFDLAGVIVVVLISAVIIGVTQWSVLSTKVLDRFDISMDFMAFSEKNGLKFDQGLSKHSLNSNTREIVFENPNGDITITTGEVAQIEILTTLWVAKMSQEKATKIADQSRVVSNLSGDTLTISAKGERYGSWLGQREPRMNMEIIIPAQLVGSLEFKMKNGALEATNLRVDDVLKVETTNGSITFADVDGEIEAKTTNGKINATNIKGDISLETTNGSIKVEQLAGKVSLDTTNGSIEAVDVEGPISVETTNGKIKLDNANGRIEAETTNGSITVSSAAVGGNWDLETTTGSIKVYLPAVGDYSLAGKAELGGISTDLPFTIEGKKIKGIIGTGQYKITLETTGGIEVRSFDN